jgi:hypothetical protein
MLRIVCILITYFTTIVIVLLNYCFETLSYSVHAVVDLLSVFFFTIVMYCYKSLSIIVDSNAIFFRYCSGNIHVIAQIHNSVK